jgi:hypothetical protein
MSVRLPSSAVAVLSVAAASAGFAVNTLFTDRPEDQGLWSYNVNPWWWDAAWLLVIPVFLAAGRWRRVAAFLVLSASAPQWVVALVILKRYGSAYDTYEIPGLVHVDAVIVTAVMTCAFALAAYLGSARLRLATSRQSS